MKAQRENNRYSQRNLPLWGKKPLLESFPGGSVVKNSPANPGDLGSIPGMSHMLLNN